MVATTQPFVKVNTFIHTKSKRFVDHLSKLFIFFEFLLGLNRIPVLGSVKPLLRKLAIIYILIFNSFVLYLTIAAQRNIFAIISNIKLAQLYFCTIFGFVIWKRLRLYYDELDKFDTEIGQTPKISIESIIIAIETTGVAGILLFLLLKDQDYPYIAVYMIHTLEYNYYGHLLCLLIQRLRLINRCVSTSISRKKVNKMNFPMSKLIDFYHIMIDAYDLLVDAIKWQFLVMLTSSFAYLLMNSYNIVATYINTTMPLITLVSDTVLAMAEMIPLLATCMCCDLLRAEVRKLRELLASKLYEDKIDKSSRGIARALLALTETRNMSFSLLRMVDISISLPFTFLSLLVTYLIIMLQFQKVITPNK